MSDVEDPGPKESAKEEGTNLRQIAKTDVFTIETFLPSLEERMKDPHGLEPAWDAVEEVVPPFEDKVLTIEHYRNGQKWILEITIMPPVTDYEVYGTYNKPTGYVLALKPPSLPEGAAISWQSYEATCFGTTWKEAEAVGERSELPKSTITFPAEVGVEVTITYNNWRSKRNFSSQEEMKNSDVTLVVEDKRYYAHRALLSMVSDHFNTMFTGEGEFCEKYAEEVTLEEVDPEVLEAFLHCVYPCGSDPPECHLVPLTFLADRYQAGALLEKCHETLKWTTAVSNVEKLRVAVKTSGSELMDHVIEMLTAEDVKDLVDSKLMNDIDQKSLAKILSKAAGYI